MGACWLSANWGMLMGDLLKVFFLQRIRVFWVLPLVLLVCHGRWLKTLQDFAKRDQEMKCKMKNLQLTDVESFAMTRFVRPALREGTINTQRNLQSSTLQCNDGAGFCWYLTIFSAIMKWNWNGNGMTCFDFSQYNCCKTYPEPLNYSFRSISCLKSCV